MFVLFSFVLFVGFDIPILFFSFSVVLFCSGFELADSFGTRRINWL